MTRSAVAASAFLLTAGFAHAEELTCRGPFAKDADHSRLLSAFGQANVTRETIYGPEGLESEASIVFPNDPARRLTVTWWDEADLKRPARIEVQGSGWSGPKELRIGTSLAAVEEMNGKPFSLYGFEWDYGGAVADWKGGALNRVPGGCRLGVIFEVGENTSEAVQSKVAGDSQFSSNAPVMRAAKPKVKSLSLGYSAQE